MLEPKNYVYLLRDAAGRVAYVGKGCNYRRFYSARQHKLSSSEIVVGEMGHLESLRLERFLINLFGPDILQNMTRPTPSMGYRRGHAVTQMRLLLREFVYVSCVRSGRYWRGEVRLKCDDNLLRQTAKTFATEESALCHAGDLARRRRSLGELYLAHYRALTTRKQTGSKENK
jgi:hypothetical protein